MQQYNNVFEWNRRLEYDDNGEDYRDDDDNNDDDDDDDNGDMLLRDRRQCIIHTDG